MDSILLIPPGASGMACSLASAIQLGSWLQADPGPDFGTHDLIHTLESSNALTDGGVFTARFAPPRKMSFPLLVNPLGSQGASNMLQWEAKIRRAAMTGAMLAVQPEGVATSEAVFFDVIDGRWEPDYNVFHNRAARRKGLLHVDTQPFGYWPTEIVLASAASVGFIGNLAVNGASVIGDVPPLARVQIIPSVASAYILGANLGTAPGADMIAYSLGARPSFAAFMPAGSFFAASVPVAGHPAINPTLAADAFAPASQAWYWCPTPNGEIGDWTVLAWANIPSALEPAYRGRFRAFAFVKQSGAASLPYQTTLDAERAIASSFGFMASSNQIATTIAAATYFNSNFQSTPSLAYAMLDMGEITLPPQASGLQGSVRLRMWFGVGSNVNSATFSFGGVFLLPVDGAAGILTKGLCVPTLGGGFFGAATQAGLDMNTGFVDQIMLRDSGALSGAGAYGQVLGDGRAYFRGITPRLGASTQQLVFVTGDRVQNMTPPSNNGNAAVMQANVETSQASVSYRPSFQFLHGI